MRSIHKILLLLHPLKRHSNSLQNCTVNNRKPHMRARTAKFTSLFVWKTNYAILKNIEPEMMTGVITPLLWIKIDPRLVVSGNLHLRRIPMVQVRSTLIEFRGVKIVRIIHVRIVVKPLPILRIGRCPLLTISLLCRSGIGHQE